MRTKITQNKRMKKLQIIETPDYILAVSDEEIKEGDYQLVPMIPKVEKATKENIHLSYMCYKIIVYQPKNNAPELDLPLLPEMVVEDYSLEAAKQFAYSQYKKLEDKYGLNKRVGSVSVQNVLDTLEVGVECGYKFATKASRINVEEDVQALADKHTKNLLLTSEGRTQRWWGFIEGYRAATKVYSEEDLRKAIQIAKDSMGVDNDGETCYSHLSTEQIVQSLKQPKTPKYFVAETVDEAIRTDKDVNGENGFKYITKLKTTTIDGKTYLVGKYEY